MKIKIKSKKLKGKFIYGDFLENKKATTLVVFLSGFSGSREFSLFKNASSEFFKNGFSAFRFNFCNDNEDKYQKIDAPKIKDMSFPFYIAELKNIIDILGKKYFRIALVGHSFGAVIAILFLNKHKKYLKKTDLILWDPSLLPWKKEWMEEDFIYDADKKLYRGKIGKETINKIFFKECIIVKNSAEILESLNQGACIIAAENSGDADAKKYFLKIRSKKDSKLFIIKKTGHQFKGKKAQKELFEKTINFLE
jgi:alpha/beta superfamily hydrolase